MYSTDVTDAQWNNIKNYLIGKERKRKISLRSVWNALMYVVKTGCQWRMLPKDFPSWQLVYYYYRKRIDAGLFDMILEKLRSKVRISKGQKSRATVGIMDSQSVRWGDNRSFKSYDGNKKVKGIKRHVIVDKNGFLLAIMVTVAHIHDSKAVMLLMRVLQDCFHSIRVIIADGSYCGDVINEVKLKLWETGNQRNELAGYGIYEYIRDGSSLRIIFKQAFLNAQKIVYVTTVFYFYPKRIKPFVIKQKNGKFW